MKTEGNQIVVSHINIRESISMLLFRIVALDIIGAVVVALFFVSVCQAFPGAKITEWLLSFNVLFFITLGLLKIFTTIFIVLQWLNEYYELTPKEIVHKRGFIYDDAKRYQLEYVRTLKLHQGILGRIFNYGSISLQDIRRKEFVQLYLIHNPHRYMHILEKLIENPHEESRILRPHLFSEDDIDENEHVEETELGPQSVR